MNRKEYIDSLDEIVNDEIFITNEVNLLDKEISNNCWTISESQEILDQLTVDDLKKVFMRIKANRTKQLIENKLKIDLIFYMWFDDQASQLRFNFINSNHEKLPFGSKIKIVSSENVIIKEFLNSEYHNGIPMSKLEEIDMKTEVENNIDNSQNELNVYSELLSKLNTKA